MVHQTIGQAFSWFSWFKYILCYGSSDAEPWYGLEEIAFKYILCYGSSELLNGLNIQEQDLNTSYVMVHRNIVITGNKII